MRELKYAHYILKIDELKSISKASEQLYISQPALSRILNLVERELGFSIFNRKTLPIRLTPQGERYLQYLKQIQELEQKMLRQIQRTTAPFKKKIRIGIAPERGLYLYSQILPEAESHFPDFELEIKLEYSYLLERLFYEKKLDVCILNAPLQKPSARFVELEREPILMIASQRHPDLSRLKDNNTSDASSYPFLCLDEIERQGMVVLNEQQRIHMVAQHILESYCLKPREIVSVFNYNTALQLVVNKNMLTLIPESILKKSDFRSQVQGFYIGRPPYTWPFLLLCQESVPMDLIDFITARSEAYHQEKAPFHAPSGS
ncbi:LysR family transcriptional regulator [Cuneatibacter sp. NSJ-177]|uniref:LysR family transcriptional regulator n=1 Tax=Cuneatibacter sp. NSJ-177 TaxID=2931401 RepID=UPI001FD4F070|nr:LysR family transcriptional regulator [Cuneatibacter sp. NSJ-177]